MEWGFCPSSGRIVLVQNELGEPGAIPHCFQARCLAVLQALRAGYGWACNRPIHTEPKINSLLRKS